MKKPQFEVNEIVILRNNDMPYKIAQVNSDCTYRLFSTDRNFRSYHNGTIGCFREGLLKKPSEGFVFEVFNNNDVIIIRNGYSLKEKIISLFIKSQYWDYGNSFEDSEFEQRKNDFIKELETII